MIFAESFAGIPAERVHWKPGPDRWSAVEIAAHLKDIEVEDFREDVDIILNRPSDPWPSFDEMAWVTERGYNDRDFGKSVEAFLTSRDETLTWLASLGSMNLTSPYRGVSGPGCFADDRPATAGDLLTSWVAHDLFHIRQLALLHWDILKQKDSGFSPVYSGFEA